MQHGVGPDHSSPREAVERLLTRRTSFERIEAFIEDLALPQDQKSALWLFAWAGTDHATRRVVVDELLRAVMV